MKRSLISAALTLLLGGTATMAQDMPFGSAADADYAGDIWAYMQESRLVGPGMIRTSPYEGTDPHGMMLETFYTTATINGHEGDLIVKRNFGPVGVSEDEVLRDPDTIWPPIPSCFVARRDMIPKTETGSGSNTCPMDHWTRRPMAWPWPERWPKAWMRDASPVTRLRATTWCSPLTTWRTKPE